VGRISLLTYVDNMMITVGSFTRLTSRRSESRSGLN
jgi:hypothetical protein